MRRRRSFITDAYGILRAADADSAGVGRSSRATAVRSGEALRPFRGTYVAAAAVGDLTDVRAAVAHLGTEAVVVLGSAAIAHGLDGLPRRWTPQVAMPPGLERAQREGVEIHFWDLPADHIEVLAGMPVTSVRRTLADVCRLLRREHAVALVDSALHKGLIGPADLDGIRDLMARRRSCVTGRRHLDLSRVGAQSPGETRTRLILTDAGLPPDALQVELRDGSGRLIGYADLGYCLPDASWLLVEFDGRSVHELPEAVLADRRRQNAIMTGSRDRLVRVTWEDTYAADTLPGLVRPTLTAAGWRPGRYPPPRP